MGWFSQTVKTALFCLSLIAIYAFSPPFASASNETTLLGFTFRFDGVDYNPTTNLSTWHYTVTGPMVSGPTYKDLSHWIIELCVPHKVVEASGNWERRTRPDPHHGIIGIKWDNEVSKTGSRSFYFVLEGNWAVADTLQIGAKAGPNNESGVLPGPACEADMCRIDYSITARNDWRFLKPGEYAAPTIQVRLWGDSGVRLHFRDFRDAEYAAGWRLSQPIVFEYSIGQTLADADNFGWYSARQFNDLEVVIPKHDVQGEALVTIWMRALLTEANRSSEYDGGGRVILELLCD